MTASANQTQEVFTPTSGNVMRRYLSRKEAAAYLGLKPETLAVWASEQRYSLPFYKIGGRAKYLLEDLEAFAKSRSVVG